MEVQDIKKYSEKFENILETISSPLKPWLPLIARFLLVVTFLEDSLRITSQWSEQTVYLEKYRGFHWTLSRSFLALNVFTMLICSILAMLKKYTEAACTGLALVVVSQAVGYGLIFDTNFFLRNLSVVGGLLMLLADAISSNYKKNRNAYYFFAGLSSSSASHSINMNGSHHHNNASNASQPIFPFLQDLDKSAYFQLAGRILLVFLFMSFLFAGEFSILRMVVTAVGAIGCVMIIVGFKTKWTAWFLVTFLSISNVALNNWWSLHHGHPQKDFLKYDFFQTLSIMGGFLLLGNLGPGGLSMDEKKKSF
ncbi:hypothetical protein SeMB42_g05940 [Synchytrium endobioticum]|uniref:Surfeit locus protein 4 n=1 Tax=Synchytrium endobioticum TaxID=286115 RepID=A0A507DB00_9FUNG|nr:hypothetical protein SeMB42_g05940 [Synchytrium endobioticum]TPX48080.1 hypothetical protein SeLEV6574_g02252 [Synchytrium endobioticum]